MSKIEDQEGATVKCAVCGARMTRVESDLPFKTTDRTIVILKGVPAIQCDNCGEYVIEDGVLRRVDEILATVVWAAELAVIRFAA